METLTSWKYCSKTRLRECFDKAGSTAIISAAKNGHVDVVKVLIQNGADVNDSDYRERTALHFAAQRGDVGVVKVLIQNGADVNAVDTECQFTALNTQLNMDMLMLRKC